MMTVDEYQQWMADPLTVRFHQFMRDYRQSLMDQWATGNYAREMHNAQQVGRAMMLHELCELADDAIGEFYRQTTKGSDDVREDQGNS